MGGVGALELVKRSRQSGALGSCRPGAAVACAGLSCGFVGTIQVLVERLGAGLAAVAWIRELARMDILTMRGHVGWLGSAALSGL